MTNWADNWVEWEDVKIRDGVIDIPSRIVPVYYNTQRNLLQFDIGNKLQLKFQDKYKVKKEYKGRTETFIVNNCKDAYYRIKSKRLALVPVNKIDSFKKDDVIYLTCSDRFECLEIDLFPCNMRPFYGWKNKTVDILT